LPKQFGDRLTIANLVRRFPATKVASGGLTALSDGSFSRRQCSLLQMRSAACHMYDDSMPALHRLLHESTIQMMNCGQTAPPQSFCMVALSRMKSHCCPAAEQQLTPGIKDSSFLLILKGKR